MRKATVVAALAVLLSSCASGTLNLVRAGGGRIVYVVAGENFWGSIADQIGGLHAHVISVIDNPNVDPHSYEPTALDAENVAQAQLVVENGIGYDSWLGHLVAADGERQTVLDAGHLLGQPDDGNPHVWYNAFFVQTVARALEADMASLDPADSAYFAAEERQFEDVGLAGYHQLISQIRTRYAGTPVGASESIFAWMAPVLGLDLLTPPTFLKAVSEGTDVSAADKVTIDRQIHDHLIRIYVYNSQNATPDVQAQLAECRSAGIPTATITETLTPASLSFQAWQSQELQGILGALEEAR